VRLSTRNPKQQVARSGRGIVFARLDARASAVFAPAMMPAEPDPADWNVGGHSRIEPAQSTAGAGSNIDEDGRPLQVP